MTAVITGTSSGIGKSTALLLIENNIEVIGFSRTPSEIQNPLFKEYLIDLTDLKAFEKLVREIKKEKKISVIVNNAGCGYYGLHEELNASMIHEMVTVNLEVPMLLTSIFLRDFKKNKGQIINISSVTAKEINPHDGSAAFQNDGVGYHIPWCQLQPVIVPLHEPLPRSIQQVCPLAPHRFGNQEAFPGVPVVEGGGVELHQAQILDRSSQLIGKGDAVPSGNGALPYEFERFSNSANVS